jgi:hypothetical protein
MCEKAKKWYEEARTRIDTNAKSLSLDAYLSLYRSYFGGDDFQDKEKKDALEVFRQCLEIVEKGFCHVHDIGNENPESLDLHGSILASVLKNMFPSDEKECTNQLSNAKNVYRAQIQVAKIQSWLIWGCFL